MSSVPVGRRDPATPEVVRAADPVIRRIAVLMDSFIRLGPVSIGLDGIVGLIPGIGDVLGGLVSAYIIWRAGQEGVPRATLTRMMTNVAIDTLLGSIPFVGDIFDFAWKANMKNLRLYEEWAAGKRRGREGRDIAFTVLVVAGILLLLLIPIAALVWAIHALVVK